MPNMDAIGWIWDFWLQIQNLLKNWVRMMYRSSWLVEVTFSWNVAETQIWPQQVPLTKFEISDFRSRFSSKIRSGWYITLPIWVWSKFFKMWLTHKSSYSRCHRLNFKFLIGYSESPENSGQDDIWYFLFGQTLFFLSHLCHGRCF